MARGCSPAAPATAEYMADASTDATGAYGVGPLRRATTWWRSFPIGATATSTSGTTTARPPPRRRRCAVTAGSTTYGIDAVLGKGAEISGVVTGADGQGLDDVGVYLGRYWTAGGSTASTGRPTPWGTYEVAASAPATTRSSSTRSTRRTRRSSGTTRAVEEDDRSSVSSAARSSRASTPNSTSAGASPAP